MKVPRRVKIFLQEYASRFKCNATLKNHVSSQKVTGMFLPQLSKPGSTHLFLNKSSREGLLAGSRVKQVWMNFTIPGISLAGTTPLAMIWLSSVSSEISSLNNPIQNKQFGKSR